MIGIKALNKFFNKGRQSEIHVLNDVSLSLPEKGMVAIFGKSGCGKTTLLNVIGGLDGFHSGEITIDGNDIGRNTDLIRNKYVGYIFQNYNLTKNETSFDNVAAALRLCGLEDEKEIATRVAAALKNVDMEQYAKRTPDTLSGGQQQRIAIARAIVKNPKIILADEPTGNLDEINTVMIMNLLKSISKEHLVVLVTHEESLVDHYCDRVIELSDGKVVSTKNNASAKGFVSKSKNDLYLGEYEKSLISDGNARVEYYGEPPASPITIKIINRGGKIYLKPEGEDVQLIDASSEIKVHEGVYEEGSDTAEKKLDMSALPTVEGKKFGRLFTFFSSLKSGYRANFQNRKRGSKALSACMILFSMVTVFMSSLFGMAFKDLSKADAAYNHNVFYLYTPNGEVSAKLKAATQNEDSGIDSIRISGSYTLRDVDIAFRTGSFETFTQFDFGALFRTNAVFLDSATAKSLPLLEGKNTPLLPNEILLSSRVADSLLERSTLGYIKERRDLVGLLSTNVAVDGAPLRIAGIVESEETAVYLPSLSLAKYTHDSIFASNTALASRYGISVNDGESLLAIPENIAITEFPALNDTVKIQGESFKVTEIRAAISDYGVWLVSNGIDKTEEKYYFTALVKKDFPDLAENSVQFSEEYDKKRDAGLYEYYDYFYSEFDDFCRDLAFFETDNIDIWLYTEKGIETAKYTMLPENYYRAVAYKRLYGKYPTETAITEDDTLSHIPKIYEEMKQYYALYENEFYKSSAHNAIFTPTYLVSDNDYVTLSKSIGETHPSAKTNYDYALYDYKEYETYPSRFEEIYYTVIHSNAPEKTKAWLENNFSDLTPPSEYEPTLVSPDDVYEEITREIASEIIAKLIAMATTVLIMCICTYFIMHASLMNRIKEVGIYRAIGVSKKNLIFRFLIESALILILTVVIGYVISSAFLLLCINGSSLLAEIFYYPVWLAASVFAVISSATLFCGTLPVILLLRKTPSQILSKYDI